MMIRPDASRSLARNAGFTLIEILAVMMILAILGAFLLQTGRGSVHAVEIRTTQTFLAEVTALVEDYHNEHGAYPTSSFPSDLDKKPSKTNGGIEALVIQLWRSGADWQARELGEDNLDNLDGDSCGRNGTSFSSESAFEIVDIWKNPIAYLHRRDYDTEFTYFGFDDGDNEVESRVTGRVSKKTGDPYRRGSFQLISAGPDGEFGTEDDIANFEIDE